jgi:tRNA (guanine37-N1)-methyltransferase
MAVNTGFGYTWPGMRFDLITIFPEFFTGPLDHGIVRRAREANLVDVNIQDLRVFTKDRHRSVDDRPFGGGEGMVLKPEPLFEAVEALLGHSVGTFEDQASRHRDPKTAIVLLSAAGQLFRQETARRFAQLDRIIFICGRYEGVDERVAEHLATDELSIGDFVLSGGELPAMLIIDAVTRLLPGALGNEASSQNESFSGDYATDLDPALEAQLSDFRRDPSSLSSRPWFKQFRDSLTLNANLLDFPHYTRPAEYRGWPVPETLLSGNHEQIRLWRREMAIHKTLRNRPDLVQNVWLGKANRAL